MSVRESQDFFIKKIKEFLSQPLAAWVPEGREGRSQLLEHQNIIQIRDQRYSTPTANPPKNSCIIMDLTFALCWPYLKNEMLLLCWNLCQPSWGEDLCQVPMPDTRPILALHNTHSHKQYHISKTATQSFCHFPHTYYFNLQQELYYVLLHLLYVDVHYDHYFY